MPSSLRKPRWAREPVVPGARSVAPGCAVCRTGVRTLTRKSAARAVRLGTGTLGSSGRHSSPCQSRNFPNCRFPSKLWPMPTTIRLARRNELQTLVSLFGSYLTFYGKTVDVPKCTRFLGERLTAADSVIFVAEVDSAAEIDGALAGFAQLYPSWSSLSQRRNWILNDLYVDPHFRRQGVARKLIETCTAHSEKTGAKGLTLQTATDNLEAQALYRSLGWSRDEQFLTYYLEH